MELKPSKDKQALRPRLDGLGGTLRTNEHKNPWAQLARGVAPRGPKRRRYASDTLGATPPRDGAFSVAAADVAVTRPPATRGRQQRLAGGVGSVFVTKK